VQEMLNTKKFGDIAFRDKDFKSAIDYYSKVNALFLSPFFFVYKGIISSEIQMLAESMICSIFWLSMNFFNDNKVHNLVCTIHRVHKYILFSVFKG
jgi:hypothetical protein